MPKSPRRFRALPTTMLWAALGVVVAITPVSLQGEWDIGSTESLESFSWYDGTIEAAFDDAQAKGRPLFLYWGAQWCPPCAEIKSQVFAKPEFAVLMRRVIPVYLDGDHERAQSWGEMLGVSGYPTILLLKPNREEMLRLQTSVTIDEFSRAFLAAMSKGDSFWGTQQKVLSGKGDALDWQILAFARWKEIKTQRSSRDVLSELYRLNEISGGQPPWVRGLLAAQLLEMGVSLSKSQHPDVAALLKGIQQNAGVYLSRMLDDPLAVERARSTILYAGPRILKWVDGSSSERDQLVSRWLRAAEAIGANESLSIDTRLWSVYPSVEFWRMTREEGQEWPEALVEKVRAKVVWAEAAAKTPLERKAVVSGAASLLRKTKQFALAKQILLSEFESSDTPWYYARALSRLAEVVGDAEEEQTWSRRSVELAQGSATRLQWVAADLKRLSKLPHQEAAGDFATGLDHFYKLAFSLEDGFLGRNRGRARQIHAGIDRWWDDQRIKGIVLSYADRCSQLSGENSKYCNEHFDRFLNEAH